ncbi:MAG TPA: RNA polymerase sigma factor [Anaerolineaceae bacterium]|nr:RNA polymerase sigma factor [Anaerolineaceae bacterium]
MEDTIAIQRLKEGDASGLEFLVNKYQLKATQAAWLIVRDHHVAEDLVCQGFLKAYQSIRQFKNEGRFQSWFFRIVVNLAIDYLRSQKRFVDYEAEELENDQRFASAELSVEEQLERTQTMEELGAAFRKLDPEQRAVLVARYFLGLGEKETAAQLGKPVSTIKWRRFTALRQLRQALMDGLNSSERKEKQI